MDNVRMIILELTDERYEKFYLNASLIEVFHPLMGNNSEIRLTTGRSVVCIESNEWLVKKLREAAYG